MILNSYVITHFNFYTYVTRHVGMVLGRRKEFSLISRNGQTLLNEEFNYLHYSYNFDVLIEGMILSLILIVLLSVASIQYFSFLFYPFKYFLSHPENRRRG